MSGSPPTAPPLYTHLKEVAKRTFKRRPTSWKLSGPDGPPLPKRNHQAHTSAAGSAVTILPEIPNTDGLFWDSPLGSVMETGLSEWYSSESSTMVEAPMLQTRHTSYQSAWDRFGTQRIRAGASASAGTNISMNNFNANVSTSSHFGNSGSAHGHEQGPVYLNSTNYMQPTSVATALAHAEDRNHDSNKDHDDGDDGDDDDVGDREGPEEEDDDVAPSKTESGGNTCPHEGCEERPSRLKEHLRRAHIKPHKCPRNGHDPQVKHEYYSDFGLVKRHLKSCKFAPAGQREFEKPVLRGHLAEINAALAPKRMSYEQVRQVYMEYRERTSAPASNVVAASHTIPELGIVPENVPHTSPDVVSPMPATSGGEVPRSASTEKILGMNLATFEGLSPSVFQNLREQYIGRPDPEAILTAIYKEFRSLYLAEQNKEKTERFTKQTPWDSQAVAYGSSATPSSAAQRPSLYDFVSSAPPAMTIGQTLETFSLPRTPTVGAAASGALPLTEFDSFWEHLSTVCDPEKEEF